MSAGMPMPGGWTMSMMWMRMPGQTWPGAAASFVEMWIMMMAAMMLPSLIATLLRNGQVFSGPSRARLASLTALAGVGYFFVWTAIGLAVFPLGVALAAAAMQEPTLARAAPLAGGVVVLIAGAFQCTACKARRLACCRRARGHGSMPTAGVAAACRHGVDIGLQCAACCGNLMAIPLVMGIMDLRVMAVATAAITIERVAPDGDRVAWTIGVAVVGAAMLLIARAAAHV